MPINATSVAGGLAAALFAAHSATLIVGAAITPIYAAAQVLTDPHLQFRESITSVPDLEVNHCTRICTWKMRDGAPQGGCALRQGGSPAAVSVVWPGRFAS